MNMAELTAQERFVVLALREANAKTKTQMLKNAAKVISEKARLNGAVQS
ncbi:hypothetical protein [Propionivibrio dicarboxylicus]|uniref:Uncharacterized protein n=1 Tax=Propionivibrio dicarboxylicus TaxID=83767 RepID=A0A1G8L7D6_9RHOO|nr:hypothetical protein [Propionivibrio dicarboxylicus]SDI51634.1 hypothetical protein SAMN05660652_03564 [Propionivibrio dicarboxylicus]